MLKDISHKIPAYSDVLYDVLSFAGGMNSRASEIFLSRDTRFSLQKDQARFITNMVRTQSGLLITRPGRAKLNSVAAVPALGDIVIRSIFELKPVAATAVVIATAGDTIFKYSAGSLVSVGTTTTLNRRFLWTQFKDKALGINGVDAMITYDGGAATSTIGGAPTDGNAICSHRNRVWVLAGRSLKYSALGDETDWTTPNNAGTVPVPITRGGGGTGMISLWDRLIVWTTDQIFQLVGTGPTDFELSPISIVYGHAGSPAAVLAAGNDVYFCSKKGVGSLGVAYAQSVTGDVSYTYVSGIVEPTWQEIDTGNLANVVGVHDSMHNLLIFLCNRTGTLNSEAFVADYYHLDSNGQPTWSMYSNMPFASAAEVNVISSEPQVLFGGYDGFIYKQTDTDESDNGVPIPIQLVYKTDLELPFFDKLWRHMLLFAGGEETILSGNITYDFGESSIPIVADISVSGGDTIGGTFVVGESILGATEIKQLRVPIPSHGRFATIIMGATSTHRVIIGGFIIYAGVRRTIKH